MTRRYPQHLVRRRRSMVAMAVAVVGMLLSACGDGASPPSPPPPPPPGARSLVFVVEPSQTEGTVAIVPAPQVVIRDRLGNTDTSARDAVTVRLGANPAGGTLTGTTVVNAVAG